MTFAYSASTEMPLYILLMSIVYAAIGEVVNKRNVLTTTFYAASTEIVIIKPIHCLSLYCNLPNGQ